MEFGPKKFEIEYNADFSSTKKIDDLKIWVAKPKTSIYQKIEGFKISKKPKSFYKEKHANKIMYFDFKKINNLNLKIKIKAILTNSKFELTNKIITPQKGTKLFNENTKSEKFLEQTPRIKRLTNQIIRNDESVLEKIVSITNFLKTNFKYVYPVKKRGVKNLNLKNLKGDCGEVGALFVTMCRILKIPTVNKAGYVIYYDELGNIYEHGWTSIYLNNLGWLDIDPLAENIKKIKNKYIYEQKNYFFTLISGFNIEIKPPIPKNHKIDYWKNLGLPITKNSVQIIQPLIFSSKNKLNFEEHVKLTK